MHFVPSPFSSQPPHPQSVLRPMSKLRNPSSYWQIFRKACCVLKIFCTHSNTAFDPTFVWLGKAKRLSLCRENSNTNVTALLVNLYIPLSCQIQSPLNDNPSCFAFSALIEGSMADLGRGAGNMNQLSDWALYISCCPAVCDALQWDAPLLFCSIEQLLRHQALAGDRC